MSLFTWPFKRKQYAGIGNPRFISDVVAANEAINDALAALIGTTNIPAGGTLIIGQSYLVQGGSIIYNSVTYTVGQIFTAVTGFTTFTTSAGGFVVSNDFFIVSGLDYITGVTNSFNPGIFYLQGQFYVINTAFNEGLYLAPSPADTMSQPFGDGNSRDIYTLMQAVSTSTAAATNTPVFSGNMNGYRIGLKYTNTLVQALLSTTAALGTAAFINASATPSTGLVALWNNLLTAAQIAANYLNIGGGTLTGALILNADPTANLGSATKQYVDNSISGVMRILARGNVNVGDIGAGAGTSYNLAWSDIGTTSYLVIGTIEGHTVTSGTNPDACLGWCILAASKTSTGCTVHFQEFYAGTQNINFNYIIVAV